MALDLDASGRIARARFAFGGVAAIPLRCRGGRRGRDRPALERSRRWSARKTCSTRTLDPISDHRGSAEYRLAVAKSLVEKFRWERREAAA